MDKPVQILLAEDNPADVYLIEEALREHKIAFELTVAEDGEAAIGMIVSGKTHPDLILLDLNMPKRSGGEVLTHLREQPHCRTTPVIVLTSSDSPSDREEVLRLGATSYIRKPTGLDEFLQIGAAIKQLLSK
jgi:two-component system, chemotaxis family, response regulator Rcp1